MNYTISKAQKVSVDLPIASAEGSPPSFLDLLSDDRNLLELRNDTEASARLLHDLERVYARLRCYPTSCVLLDFDVISHFASLQPIEESQAGLDALALDIFFIQGQMKYALPLGAYRELFSYLRHIGLGSERFPKSVAEPTRLSRNQAIREIISFICRTKLDPSERIEDLEEEIKKTAWATNANIARLLSLFFNPRFDGCRPIFNTREKDGWLDIQEAHVRRWQKSDASAALENDSINLAIALSDFLAIARGARRKPREGFLLLTKTGALANLLVNCTRNPEMALRAAQHFDCRLTMALSEQFPVITPQRMALLEWFGPVLTDDDAGKHFRLAKHYVNRCNIVKKDIEELISEKSRHSTIDKFYKARQTHLEESFRNLLAVARLHRPFELNRRMLSSVKASQNRLQAAGVRSESAPARDADFSLSEINLVDTHAMRVLEQIDLAISNRPCPSYQIRFERPACNIANFEIYQEPSLRNEIAVGLLCYDPERIGAVLNYTMWWDVTTSDVEFRWAMSEIFRSAKTSQSASPTSPRSFEPIGEFRGSTDCAHITIETSKGTYIARIPPNSDWKWLELSYLARVLENSIGLTPIIETIRIESQAANIYYEVWPRDGERVMSIESSFELSDSIATLIYSSTQYYTDQVSLAKALKGVLKRFPASKMDFH